jgi:hypothetical protein
MIIVILYSSILWILRIISPRKKRTIDKNRSFASNIDSQVTKLETVERSFKGLNLKRKIFGRERNNLRL